MASNNQKLCTGKERKIKRRGASRNNPALEEADACLKLLTNRVIGPLDRKKRVRGMSTIQVQPLELGEKDTVLEKLRNLILEYENVYANTQDAHERCRIYRDKIVTAKLLEQTCISRFENLEWQKYDCAVTLAVYLRNDIRFLPKKVDALWMAIYDGIKVDFMQTDFMQTEKCLVYALFIDFRY